MNDPLLNKPDIPVSPSRVSPLDDTEMASLFGDTSDGMTISVRGVTYGVPKTTILQEVDLVAKPGEMCAIMGPSGAGKTTLMDLIAGRKTGGTQQGDILFNGRPRNRYFRRVAAYVMQTDVHIASLTVKETLLFAARLRMNSALTYQEKEQRVRHLMAVLGLDHVADHRVGDELHRGISGGEKKRLGIGVEIINLPHIIFLDEPTSGLDSEKAYEVMRSVRRVADSNRTVLSTIHQPSADVFALFDTLLLLSHGQVVYHGKISEAIRYFTSDPLNFVYSQGQNPADFALAVGSGHAPRTNSPLPTDSKTAENLLHSSWRTSANFREVRSELAKTCVASPTDAKFDRELAASTWYQIWTLVLRNWLTLLRDRRTVGMLIIRSPVIALFMGSLFYHQGKCGPLTTVGDHTVSSSCLNPFSESCEHCSEAVYNRFSMLFFAVMFLMMGNLQAISGLCSERVLFYRERDSGAYNTLAYFVGSSFSMIPFIIVSTLLYSVPLYYLVGFRPEKDAVAFHLLVSLTMYLIGFFYAQFLAAAAPSPEVALAAFPLTFIFLTVFAGFLIHIPEVPAGWKWAPVISFVRWSVQAMVVNEFESQPELRYYNGQDILHTYGYAHHSKWESVYVLVATAAVIRIATYVVLRFVRFGTT